MPSACTTANPRGTHVDTCEFEMIGLVSRKTGSVVGRNVGGSPIDAPVDDVDATAVVGADPHDDRYLQADRLGLLDPRDVDVAAVELTVEVAVDRGPDPQLCRIHVAGTFEKTGCACPSMNTGPVTWAAAGPAASASTAVSAAASAARMPPVARPGAGHAPCCAAGAMQWAHACSPSARGRSLPRSSPIGQAVDRTTACLAQPRAEGCRSGTSGSRASRRSGRRDGGVTSSARSPAGRDVGAA